MTFDNDFLQLEFDGGTKRVTCKGAGVDWPPPERINVMGIPMRRKSFSQLTDEQRAGMDFLMRGARYVPDDTSKPDPMTREQQAAEAQVRG